MSRNMSPDYQVEKLPQLSMSTVPAEPDAKDNPTTSIGNDEAHVEISTPAELHGWRLLMVQLSLLLAVFLGSLDSSIVATALVTIGKDFNDFVRLQWVVLSYLLMYLGFALIFPRISDVIGRKWASVTAIAFLTIGSLGAGLSQSLTQLIVFRAIQGLGGSGLYSMPFTILPEITPPEKFPAVSAVAGVALISSAVLGPTLGGAITTHSTWRWIFLFNVPCGVFIICLMAVVWPKTVTAGKMTWRRLDFTGCFLCLLSTVLLIFALQEAGSTAYSWSHPIIISFLCISGMGFVALAFWVWYMSNGDRFAEPLFHTRIIRNRVILADILVATFSGYALYTTVVQLPQRFQLVNSRTSQSAGISILPLLGSSVLGSFVTIGASVGKRNLTFPIMTACAALLVIGIGLLTTVAYSPHVQPSIYAYEVISGLGLGGLLTSSIIVKLNAREEDIASAQGLLSQGRILGGNVGLAIATIVLNSHLSSDLATILSPIQIADLRKSINTIQTLTPAEAAAVSRSVSNAFQSQMRGCLGVSVACLIACLFLWQKNPPTMTEKFPKKERRRQSV